MAVPAGAAAPSPVPPQPIATDDGAVAAFYAGRAQRIWTRGGTPGAEADRLLELLRTADADGLRPGDYDLPRLTAAVARARTGSPAAAADLEIFLSQAFVRYVQDARRSSDVGMVYTEQRLKPTVPSAHSILGAAASAPSLGRHVDELGWMNPLYAQLRKRLADGPTGLSASQRALLRLNLERARALPADMGRRFVLVDAAAARLWLYQDGRAVDSMRVVVGKPSEQTPMMAGLIRYASLNPYWNVPPDLVRSRIAPNVLSQGKTYLSERGYEILSDWSDQARVVEPATIDWKKIAAGETRLRVRQLPGPSNGMGKIKFMFPNVKGVYLHDTPDKALLQQEERLFSAGCVRLEDAPRLARWLFGREVTAASGAAEQAVVLAEPVPVYITYMTAAPEGDQIAFRKDVYKRDQAQLAGLTGRMSGGR